MVTPLATRQELTLILLWRHFETKNWILGINFILQIHSSSKETLSFLVSNLYALLKLKISMRIVRPDQSIDASGSLNIGHKLSVVTPLATKTGINPYTVMKTLRNEELDSGNNFLFSKSTLPQKKHYHSWLPICMHFLNQNFHAECQT